MKEDPMNDNLKPRKMPVDCERFAEILYELDRPGTATAELSEAALVHAEMCSHCGALVTEAESLDFALGQIAHEAAELQAPPKMEAALLREFRRERSAASSRRHRWQLAALAAAAVVLVTLGLTFYRPRSATSDKAPSLTASSVPATSALTARDSQRSTTGVAANVEPKIRPTRAVRERTPAKQGDGAEYATAYLPLPYAYDPSGLEGGAVVRVVLPRAALVSYGLPVEGMGVSDQVTADMVVSEDGTPQAIRLVAQVNSKSND